MKKIKEFLFQDSLSISGLTLILISTLVFVFTEQAGSGASSGAFFINYTISGTYLLLLFIRSLSNKSRGLFKGKIEHTALLLILWFISAFALNREMNVFDSSVPWLSVWIVISSITLLLVVLFPSMPAFFKHILFFLLGAALLLFVYYAIYLLPLYSISVIGVIAIGISLHTYVPLCLALITSTIILRKAKENKHLLFTSIAGFVLPILLCIGFLIQWNNTNRKINLILNQSALNEVKLPAWIAVSQHIEKSAFTERIFKTGLVYHEVKPDGNIFWGGMPSRSFDQPKAHDPLVVIATMLFSKPNLDEKEQIKILKSMYDSRHQAQERLWSGDNLETVSVISNVKLFPEYRMAYTEKMLTIKNKSPWQWNQQEAIYTFHLSEGSVVTSLSLWINGKEEKSRLTTKAKADSAYHEVVGVERHDPSVVHWQEGNTISVRVFPCDTKENRRFKLGITSPLRKEGNRLIYENAFFEGPDATKALETLQLSFSQKPAGLQIPDEFKQSTFGVYQADRTYEPGWEISCQAPPLSSTAFSFAGTAYEVKNYQPEYEGFTPEVFYLDVNSSWSKEEFMYAWEKLKGKSVYIYDDKLIRLTNDNLQEVYALMSKLNFSLFPLFEIQNPDKAILISKSTDTSPNLNDLEGSAFSENLTAYLKEPKRIRFYNIGHQLSPYFKALKELRVLTYAQGNEDNLFNLLDKHQFVRDQENDSTVVIGDAGLVIQKAKGIKTGQAPDHLLRLFAYNDLMKKVAAVYFNSSLVQPDILAEAEQAYIVSPVSSLLVLETQKDYERFGINQSKNSLKNASMKSSGSVPEPHEWLLILLALSIAAYLIYKPKASPKNLQHVCR